jgi:hypothetical protein
MTNTIKALQKQIDKLNKEIEQINKNRHIKCKYCKKRTKISKLTLEVDMYWNYSMDDWYENGYTFKCPKCLGYNRIENDSKILELRHCFGNEIIIGGD